MNRAASARPAPARVRAAPGASRKSGAGNTLIGLFVGIVVGLGLAAGVAWYVMKSGNPDQAAGAGTTREPAREPGKQARAEPAAPEKPRFEFYKILRGGEEPKSQAKAPERTTVDKATVERSTPPDKAIAKLEDRPPPGADKAAVDKAVADKNAPKGAAKAADASTPPAKPAERLWLQAGSFAAEGDAENMKAQLAMSGLEPTVQQATLPDKGVRFRVRLGPYGSTDEMNRVKADLAKRGIDVAVIR